jgi:hypothetical protein
MILPDECEQLNSELQLALWTVNCPTEDLQLWTPRQLPVDILVLPEPLEHAPILLQAFSPTNKFPPTFLQALFPEHDPE